MSQEYNSTYTDYPFTTISYWHERCGEDFYESTEFENTYNKFINKLEKYKPREYILENLTDEKCSKNFINLIENLA